MKEIEYLLIGVLLLINSSCKNESLNKLKNPQNNKKKTQILIKQTKNINSTKDIDNLLKKNKSYNQLFSSLQKNEYSIEELIDITKQSLDYIKELRQSPKSKKIDTASVNSRLVLTEINLKRISFLLQSNTPKKDTIEKVLDIIINNMNSTINQIKIYNHNFDQFKHILTIDSIQKVKHDSIQNQIQKSINPTIKRFELH